MKKKTSPKTVLFILSAFMTVLSACGAPNADNIPAAAEPPVQEEEPAPTEEELAAARYEETVAPVLEEAFELAQGYYYEEALALLEEIPEEFSQEEEVLSAISTCTDALDSFIPYDQPVRHIFFHSLIVDTSLAFDGDYMENGYNYWMTTVDEFHAILEELYANQYILIDIHDLAEEQTDEDGNVTLTAAQPLVPEGKIPLVLSVDDVSYYDYMEHDEIGRAHV